MTLPKGIDIFAVGVEYTQKPDSCDENQLSQSLKVKTDDAGDGKFFVIETDRWTFDEIGELVDVLYDFKSRIEEAAK